MISQLSGTNKATPNEWKNGRKMKKTNTRSTIIKKSREIFKEKGFNQVSFNELIEATKDTIQRSSFYYYFKDTNFVFVAVLDECLRNLNSKYSKGAAEIEGADVFFDGFSPDGHTYPNPFEKFLIYDDDFHLIFSSLRMLFPEQVRLHSETTSTEKIDVPGFEDIYQDRKVFFSTLVKRKFGNFKNDEEIDRFLYTADSLCTILWILKDDKKIGKALKEGKKIGDLENSLRISLRILWEDFKKKEPEDSEELSDKVSNRIKELEEDNNTLLKTIAKQSAEIYNLREELEKLRKNES
jgi:AcrR family transcriptional regulator